MSGGREQRLIHYDILRILAAFSVVMLHSASQFWYELPVTDTSWLITNSYDALFRFGVPVFVMLSGALFLDPQREISVKRLFTHNILRLVILYGVWSCLYGLLDSRFFTEGATYKDYVREMLGGRYHLWFLPMLAGIYCLIPVLRSWLCSAKKENVLYFLGLFLIFQVGSATIKALIWQDDLHYLLDKADIPMACSYVGYFVLGYYMAHIGVEKRLHKWIYAAGGISAAANVVLGNLLAQRRGTPTGEIYDSYSIFTLLTAAALFLFFSEKKERLCFGRTLQQVIREISASTFGIYVMHVGLMELLKEAGLHPMTVPIVAGVPLFALLCFLVCLLVTMVLRRIPWLGRYIC